ncbi:hypothetical protein [Nocardioides psychrotolerans]|uniref:hypothetical protein n=1 Tax=Nocardioides psychrotolerans TaxID=1005945 RepID=UPI003137CE8C
MLAAARRLLTPLLTALVLAFGMVGGLVALGAAPAQAACTCAQAAQTGADSLMERIKDADAVFTGTVASSTRSEGTGADAVVSITNEVVLDRVYKGRIDDVDQTVLTTQRTQATCGLGQLQVDSRYVFIVASDSTVEGAWTDDGCSGTRAATSALIAEVQGVLGGGRSATPAPEPAPAVLTDVDTSEPTSLSRAAAPGLALVLVGFLGLILVGRLNARR